MRSPSSESASGLTIAAAPAALRVCAPRRSQSRVRGVCRSAHPSAQADHAATRQPARRRAPAPRFLVCWLDPACGPWRAQMLASGGEAPRLRPLGVNSQLMGKPTRLRDRLANTESNAYLGAASNGERKARLRQRTTKPAAQAHAPRRATCNDQPVATTSRTLGTRATVVAASTPVRPSAMTCCDDVLRSGHRQQLPILRHACQFRRIVVHRRAPAENGARKCVETKRWPNR